MTLLRVGPGAAPIKTPGVNHCRKVQELTQGTHMASQEQHGFSTEINTQLGFFTLQIA